MNQQVYEVLDDDDDLAFLDDDNEETEGASGIDEMDQSDEEPDQAQPNTIIYSNHKGCYLLSLKKKFIYLYCKFVSDIYMNLISGLSGILKIIISVL